MGSEWVKVIQSTLLVFNTKVVTSSIKLLWHNLDWKTKNWWQLYFSMICQSWLLSLRSSSFRYFIGSTGSEVWILQNPFPLILLLCVVFRTFKLFQYQQLLPACIFLYWYNLLFRKYYANCDHFWPFKMNGKLWKSLENFRLLHTVDGIGFFCT